MLNQRDIAERTRMAAVSGAVAEVPTVTGGAGYGGQTLSLPATGRFSVRSARASARGFVRGHARALTDAALIAVALANVLVLLPVAGGPVTVAVSMAAAPLLLLRRRYPFAVAALTVGWLFVGTAQVAALVALATLARARRVHWQVALGAGGVWLAWFLHQAPAVQAGVGGARHALAGAVWGGILAGVPVLIGLLYATRGDLRAKVRELASAKASVDQLAVDAARADERARLAREMHDVVSHQVTLIAMQAGALQVAEGGARTEIAGTIRQLCSKTLTELRGLVGMLRAGAQQSGKSLDEVVALAAQGGAEVETDARPRAEHVSGPVATAAFRTVQEAITNAHKHAPGAQVRVSIADAGEALAVTVTNDAPVGAAASTGADLPSGGHGLLGLRERVAAIGGTFSARPTPSGGFAVSATYPTGRATVAG